MHPQAFSMRSYLQANGGPRGAVNEEDIIPPNAKQKTVLYYNHLTK